MEKEIIISILLFSYSSTRLYNLYHQLLNDSIYLRLLDITIPFLQSWCIFHVLSHHNPIPPPILTEEEPQS